jgi:Lar family restriction alleviation protein
MEENVVVMEEKLKPCPFCGGAVIAKNNHGWYVWCEDCYAMFGRDEYGGIYTEEHYAISAWNRRAEL